MTNIKINKDTLEFIILGIMLYTQVVVLIIVNVPFIDEFTKIIAALVLLVVMMVSFPILNALIECN